MIIKESTPDCITFVKYSAKGEKEFSLPFVPVVTDPKFLEVLLDDIKQTGNFTIEKTDNQSSKVVFQNPIGSAEQPVTVTIYKLPNLQRVTNFSNFTDFTANNLNIEFDNIVANLQILNSKVQQTVKLSSLYQEGQAAIVPLPEVGKALCWGENGKIKNTDLHINNLLNQLNSWVDDSKNSVIPAHKIALDISTNTIKATNLQEFITALDNEMLKVRGEWSDYKESDNEVNTKNSGEEKKSCIAEGNCCKAESIMNQLAIITDRVNELEKLVKDSLSQT